MQLMEDAAGFIYEINLCDCGLNVLPARTESKLLRISQLNLAFTPSIHFTRL